MDEYGRKKKKKRADDGFKRGTGVDYTKVSNRHIDDDRYERPQNGMINQTTGAPALSSGPAAASGGAAKSATMDSVMRLMTGQQERGIRDKLNDSNRPTWEQYKKDNADKLDLTGKDEREMEVYRKQLDKEREERLQRMREGKGGKKSKKEKKDKKKKKKSKKEKKKKNKKKKRKRTSDDEASSSTGSEESGSESEGSDNYRLSSFFNNDKDT
ncbi:hypothetical protein TrCOL_g12003 [Triparma columacea]|uniref:Uncharacterized protein n=1 Tax=Triparma columacea TaxID=722753 RepID=A0A9W7L8F3_9STRA|nr:hypothetical protein TrCOL_g12003 [Triparma columacea]